MQRSPVPLLRQTTPMSARWHLRLRLPQLQPPQPREHVEQGVGPCPLCTNLLLEHRELLPPLTQLPLNGVGSSAPDIVLCKPCHHECLSGRVLAGRNVEQQGNLGRNRLFCFKVWLATAFAKTLVTELAISMHVPLFPLSRGVQDITPDLCVALPNLQSQCTTRCHHPMQCVRCSQHALRYCSASVQHSSIAICLCLNACFVIWLHDSCAEVH